MIDNGTLITVVTILSGTLIQMGKMHYDHVQAARQQEKAAEKVQESTDAAAEKVREATKAFSDQVQAQARKIADDLFAADKARSAKMDDLKRHLDSQDKKAEQILQVATTGNDIKADILATQQSVIAIKDTLTERA